ncbi:hypothetical protein GCM10027084_27870 [Pseudoxanthomonas sangjuensis]|uniref:hypothetical protein n=1 Tax=Pseudoxanthomonas sangjuensis TaxID=1503750 RepID=UPI001390D45F|nr:hypothetical protein [Pseudoxanthomonas sangjuensis]
MNWIPACRHPALHYFSCALAFFAIGTRQPAFVGIGFAFLGLAIAALRNNPAP